MLSGNSHISWTNMTANPTVGCDRVSPGCQNCYARSMVNAFFGGNFETIRLFPDRIMPMQLLRPRVLDGQKVPLLVFVNSMSDLMHRDIPDDFRDRVFDAMDANPNAVFQVLTKRHLRLASYIERRYRGRGVPDHIWLGVSVEDGPRGLRLDALRKLKDEVGDFTAFASVEPLIGDLAGVSFEGIDWTLFGGESGGNARGCEEAWMVEGIGAAQAAGAAVWLKQWGTWRNNPLYRGAPGRLHIDRVRAAIEAGEMFAEVATGKGGKPKILGEKGGATLDGVGYREMPPAYARQIDRMNEAGLF